MLPIIPFAHSLIEEMVPPGDQVIDATCGNGNDTLLLSTLVEATGNLYASATQGQATPTTQQTLPAPTRKKVSYIFDSQATPGEHLPSCTKENTASSMSYRGYLPKRDKKITSASASTKTA